MKKLQFETDINAPVSRVYNVMLGLDKIITYQQWTSIFNPTSTYEGNWDKGSKMLFIGTDEAGRRGGMVSEIFEVIQNQFVSIRHYGMLDGDVEITEGEEVEKWAGGFENYSFQERNGVTTVTVDIEVTEDYEAYFTENWPKALVKLKEITEESL